MSDDFLSRWSRLKRASAQASAADAKAPPQPAKGEESAARPPAPAGEVPAQPPAPLPPVESLGFDSDFTAFMKPEVGEALKRQALKTLFQDPRFNVMDGLDVYIDDYSKPDPLPEGWLEKMNQVVRLGDYQPPVEEVPREPGAQPSPAPPEPGEEAAKGPQNEALATSARPPSSDTPEAQPMPLQVTESRPSE